jgi:DNA polymerase-3 subunit epsilon/exodeoxyribonuclease X
VLLYLDVETTGLEEEDRICALGLILQDVNNTEVYEEYIKPPRKIRPEAMAVHHITNEMVSDASSFREANVVKLLKKYNSEEHVLLAHNIDFELSMLAKEGLLWKGGVIDTLKCSRHLVEEIDRFSLQFLRYELGLYKSEEDLAQRLGVKLSAHSALSDALHVKLLHVYLNEMQEDERLMALSIEPVLIKKFAFGKYKDHYLEEVAMNDSGYLHWLLSQSIDEDLEYSIKHYL